MEKIMISQPMHGFTDEQIVETRNRFLQFAKKTTWRWLILTFKMSGIQKML